MVVRLTCGLKNTAIVLCETTNRIAFMKRMPCIGPMSPGSRFKRINDFMFFRNENATNRSSVRRKLLLLFERFIDFKEFGSTYLVRWRKILMQLKQVQYKQQQRKKDCNGMKMLIVTFFFSKQYFIDCQLTSQFWCFDQASTIPLLDTFFLRRALHIQYQYSMWNFSNNHPKQMLRLCFYMSTEHIEPNWMFENVEHDVLA